MKHFILKQFLFFCLIFLSWNQAYAQVPHSIFADGWSKEFDTKTRVEFVDLLTDLIPDKKFYLSDVRSIRSHPLNFYENAILFEYRFGEKDESVELLNLIKVNDNYYLLDGKSEVMHNLRKNYEVQLNNDEKIISYFEFFMHSLTTGEGRFRVILDNVDISNVPGVDQKIAASFQPPKIFKRTGEGTYVRTTMIYSNALFQADILVTNNGIVDMTDDLPLQQNLPFSLSRFNSEGYITFSEEEASENVESLEEEEITTYTLDQIDSLVKRIPLNENLVDDSGLRQGRWTLLLDDSDKETSKKEDIFQYRIIEYIDDKPIGLVRDFHLNGNLWAEVELMQDRPVQIFDGVSTFYDEKGKPNRKIYYEKGEKVDEKYVYEGQEVQPEDVNYIISLAQLISEGNYLDGLEIAEKRFKEVTALVESEPGGLYSFYILLRKAYTETKQLRKAFRWDCRIYVIENPEDSSNWKYLVDRAINLQAKFNYKKADESFNKALSLIDGEDERNLIKAYIFEYQGMIGLLTDNYLGCKSLFQQSLLIKSEELPIDHPEIGFTKGFLGNSYVKLEKRDSALLYFRENLKMLGENYGRNHQGYVTALLNIYNIYFVTGNFETAEKLVKQMEELIDEYHINYVPVISAIGTFYMYKQKLPKAEGLFLDALSKKTDQFEVRMQLYELLAGLYALWGKPDKQEQYLLEALNFSDSLGKNNSNFTASLKSTLGMFYVGKNELLKAVDPLYEARRVFSRSRNHTGFAKASIGLSMLYYMIDEYDSSGNMSYTAMKMVKKSLGTDNEYFITAGNILAWSLQKKKNHSRALVIEKKMVDICGRVYGTNHLNTIRSISYLADHYQNIDSLQQAGTLFLDGHERLKKNLKISLDNMSERDRQDYMLGIEPKVKAFNEYCYVAIKNGEKSLAADLFNSQLYFKGLLFYSTKQINGALESDESLKVVYEDYLLQREFLSRLYQFTKDQLVEKLIDLEKEERKANMLERQLAGSSNQFASISGDIKWQEVRDLLKPTEAAVEIIRVSRYSEGEKSHHYIALIITSRTNDHPTFVDLGNASQLEDKYYKYHQNSLTGYQEGLAYEKYWSKIAKELRNVQKVYLSPDGIFNKISFAALYNKNSSQYLLDEIEVQQITGMKDLLFTGDKRISNEKSIIFGYPDYYSYEQIISDIDDNQVFEAPRYGEFRDTINALPGTYKEVLSIDSVFQKMNFKAEVYVGAQASETRLKQVTSPKVLHIATHGYFQKDIESRVEQESIMGLQTSVILDNPLFRSGLLMANAANAVRKGGQGILTAYEARNLNLQNTELVVLSACETGLGKIKNGEGVYGLQRAIKAAGAQSIIMSLWKVDDRATQEFMVLFYKNWLGRKLTKREAFKKAQLSLRKKFPEPFYWAAFIMVGEE